MYDAEAVRMVRFVKRAQELGFTLEEIKLLLELRGRSRRSRTEVSAIAQVKLRDIERKIQHLEAMHGALAQLVNACACGDRRPECPIIEALGEGTNG